MQSVAFAAFVIAGLPDLISTPAPYFAFEAVEAWIGSAAALKACDPALDSLKCDHRRTPFL